MRLQRVFSVRCYSRYGGQVTRAVHSGSRARAMISLSSANELLSVAGGFPEVHLFLGYGERAQFADVEEVLAQLDPYLNKIQERCDGEPFLAVFGGDKAVQERPDLGWLMKRMQEDYNCKLLAIQAAGSPDGHCDYSFIAEQQFETVRRTNASGVEEEVQQVLYGGTRNGKPVGGARYYLGPDFIQRSSSAGRLLTAVFVMGGGGVALEEIKYCDDQDVPWVYIPSRARNEAAYNSLYGPVHDWVQLRVGQGAMQGKQYVTVAAGDL